MAIQSSGHFTMRLDADLTSQVTAAAAQRRESAQTFCLNAIKERVSERRAAAHLTGLTARADPVLADLWDNEHDAAYDSLPAR